MEARFGNEVGFFVLGSDFVSIIASRTINTHISMIIPPSPCLYIGRNGRGYDGDRVLVEVFYPDSGRDLRLGTLYGEAHIGWSVVTADGISLVVMADAQDLYDDTVQPHQIYPCPSIQQVERW